MKVYMMVRVGEYEAVHVRGIFSTRKQAVEAAIKEIETQVNKDKEYAPFNRELVTVVDEREISTSTKQGWYWENELFRVDEYEVQGGEE